MTTTEDTLRCEVCLLNEAKGVCAVPGVPYSAAYCEVCLRANAHPYWVLVANTAAIGGLEQAADWWKEMVRATLTHLDRTPEAFQAEVVTQIEGEQAYWEARQNRDQR